MFNFPKNRNITNFRFNYNFFLLAFLPEKNEEEVEVRLHSMIFQIQFSHSKKFGLQQVLKLFMLLLLNRYHITEIDKLASIKITCRNCLKKKTTAFHSIGFH